MVVLFKWVMNCEKYLLIENMNIGLMYDYVIGLEV